MKKRSPFKLGLLLLALLLGGAIVNVAVAWTLALYQMNPRGVDYGFYTLLSGQLMENADVRGCQGGLTIVWGINPRYEEAIADGLARDDLIPKWVPVLPRVEDIVASNPAAEVDTIRYIRAWGWPCLTAWTMETEDADPDTYGMVSVHGIVVQKTGPAFYRVLPTRMIWPGFAINTIFYAAILWVVFFVPWKVKRTLRRRRGLCPACAYPIGASPVCTECGNPV